MNTDNMRVLLLIFLVSMLSACSSEKQPENTTPAPVAADNTARNQRDRAGATTTPGDQGNEADLEITANIRKAIVADKALSVNAANVKIITNAGVVTLRGPVNSNQEKSAIEAKALQVGGVTRVDNQIEIAPPK